MFYLSAFVLGLMSSLHCLGMCGPIQTAFAGGSLSRLLVYHSGRLLMYLLLGLLVGALGSGAGLMHAQQGVSLLIGFVVLTYAVFPSKFTKVNDELSKMLVRTSSKLHRFNKRPLLFRLMLGGVNGLLPCGMVYFAVSASLVDPSPMSSAGFMLLFGMGTLPLLTFLPAGIRTLWLKVSTNRPVIQKAALVLLAGLFLSRGFNLSIPGLTHGVHMQAQAPVCSSR